MAGISYDDQTAAAYKAVREVPRDGLAAWREAVRRHLRPSPRMTVVDIGAGTGAFAAAFSDWFDLAILAVEPSAAMRAQIPRRAGIQVLDGHASAIPLPDHSAGGLVALRDLGGARELQPHGAHPDGHPALVLPVADVLGQFSAGQAGRHLRDAVEELPYLVDRLGDLEVVGDDHCTVSSLSSNVRRQPALQK